MLLILLGLVFFLLIEGTVTTMPLVLLFLLVFAVLFRNLAVFALAFFAGLFLDLFALRALGQTSLFFTFFFLLVFLYERKYEITTLPFVFLSSFFGVLLYITLFGYEHAFLQAVFGMFLAGLLFKIVSVFKRPEAKQL
ncbi:MAG: hypothetical protein HY431_00175 [Candidatus Levybacteria bacterium]|nr:hypothetical protein [Candidatus Levybacteria bacterium]